MAKDTGFHISSGIDMKVFPPRCNASLSETPVIPKVDKEHGFGGPKIGKPFSHPTSLLWSRHEGEIRFPSDGNVVEVPLKDASLLHQKINKGIAGEDICVLGGLGGGDSKKDPGLSESIHHLHDLIELAPASSS